MANGETQSKKIPTRPDIATLGGLLLAAGGILGGLLIEGGKLTDIAQITALMIVLGGTIGAVMVTTPLKTLLRAAKCLGSVFFEHAQSPEHVIEEILGYATKARKNSIMSLESDLPNIADPFLRKALTLSVDGTDLQDLRSMMELDIAMQHKHGEAMAKVYEAAGGYAPTIGIIGAVLGSHPGDETSGKHRGSGPRNRGGVRGHGLWRGIREPFFPSGRE